MFVRGGRVRPGDDNLDGAGYYGYYWSSVGRSSSYAYYLDLYPSGVNPSSFSSVRHFGRSIRCVALGG